jgi:hypothetical protein
VPSPPPSAPIGVVPVHPVDRIEDTPHSFQYSRLSFK